MCACSLLGTEDTESEKFTGVLITRMEKKMSVTEHSV